MRAALLRYWELCHTEAGRKLVRYSMVSVISAGVSFVVLTFVYGVLHLWTEVPSVLFSNVVAGVPSYYLNRRWVWKRSGRSHWRREVLPFWVMSLSGIGFALYTASLARSYAQAHDLDHLARTALVVGVNMAAFGILWLVKFLILNRLFVPREIAHPAGIAASEAEV